jgi:hypothetical protein
MTEITEINFPVKMFIAINQDTRNIATSSTSQIEANILLAQMDANRNTGCINCNGCIDCTKCTNCTGCIDCGKCVDCNYRVDCIHYNNCIHCKNCEGCIYCNYCTKCNYANYKSSF